jgi:hypothetical protein
VRLRGEYSFVKRDGHGNQAGLVIPPNWQGLKAISISLNGTVVQNVIPVAATTDTVLS